MSNPSAINISTRYIFDVLRLICKTEAPIGVAEVSRLAYLPSSTAFRALSTLEETGFIKRLEHSSKFVPGNIAAQLVRALFDRYAIRSTAVPYLRQLSIGTGKTTTLCIRIGWYAVRAAVSLPVAGNYQSQRLGTASPLHATAAGIAMLSSLPEDQLPRYFAWAQKTDLQPNLPNRAEFDGEIGRAKREGMSVQLNDGGIATIGFPVVTPTGQLLGALTIDGIDPKSDGALVDFRDRWKFVLDDLRSVIAEHPDRYSDPFGHIDPDTISLQIEPD